jgi:hypothetical protein
MIKPTEQELEMAAESQALDGGMMPSTQDELTQWLTLVSESPVMQRYTAEVRSQRKLGQRMSVGVMVKAAMMLGLRIGIRLGEMRGGAGARTTGRSRSSPGVVQ